MDHAILLLPEQRHLQHTPLPQALARVMGQGDRAQHATGRRAQLQRWLRPLPTHWPVAALLRQRDAGDAALSAWLMAEPCHLHPDINGVRVLAIADGLQLTEADTAAFLPMLKPLFGDAGLLLDAPVPERWYLRLPKQSRWPQDVLPAEDLLGHDLGPQLPQGPGELRWRALLNEAQIALHHHPRNAERMAQGLLPVNGLWFWGGGVLPDAVQTACSTVVSADPLTQALAASAGATVQTRIDPDMPGTVLIDLTTLRDAAMILDAADDHAQRLAKGHLQQLTMDFLDGSQWTLLRKHRRRFWRKPARLDPA